MPANDQNTTPSYIILLPELEPIKTI